jgi:hypothetical protein
MNPGTNPVPDQRISLRKKLKGNERQSQKEAPAQVIPVPGKQKKEETRSMKKTINPDEEKEDEIKFEFK